MAAPFDSALLLDALHFASTRHRGQTRRDADASPFVTHPIETAWLLARVGHVHDPTTLVSALLHDVLEDTPATPAEIEQKFGPAVRRLVEEVTDAPAASTAERRQRQVAGMANASPAARQIRLADKIANVRSLPRHWSWLECEDYLQFAERVAARARGTNPHLDERFLRTVDRTRLAHVEGRRNRGPVASVAPAPPRASNDVPRLRVVRGLISKAEELMDAIVMGGEDGQWPSSPPASARSGGTTRRTRPRRFRDPALRRLAEPGVGSIELRPADARHTLVSIDGAEPFQVSSGQAALLEAIAFAKGDSDDGFVPFQSLRDVAAALGKGTGHRAEHSVTVALCRLQELFHEKGKVNPLLIETCRRRGVRLRLRRRAL